MPHTGDLSLGTLNAVWGSSASDVYAVGAGASFLHSTGNGVWTVQSSPFSSPFTNASLHGIWGTGSDDVEVSRLTLTCSQPRREMEAGRRSPSTLLYQPSTSLPCSANSCRHLYRQLGQHDSVPRYRQLTSTPGWRRAPARQKSRRTTAMTIRSGRLRWGESLEIGERGAQVGRRSARTTPGGRAHRRDTRARAVGLAASAPASR